MRYFFTFLCLSACGILSAQIPNHRFENWSSGEPDGWITTNIAAPSVNVIQTTDAHEGALAMRLSIVPDGSATYYAEAATTGFAMSSRPSYLSFWYKAHFLGDDFVQILSILSDSSGGSGIISYDLDSSSSVYKRMVIPYEYFTTNTCYTGSVDFKLTSASSDFGGTVGSYFQVDSVAFTNDSLVMGIPLNETVAIRVYPVPATHQVTLQYHLAVDGNISFSITDINGRTVKSVYAGYQQAGEYKMMVDVSSFTPGMHMVKLTHSGHDYMYKLVVQGGS